MVLPLDAGIGVGAAQLRECCLRVDALTVVANKQHLGRSARGHSVRLQQIGRVGGRQHFQVSVVLLDLGIRQQPAPGDCRRTGLASATRAARCQAAVRR